MFRKLDPSVVDEELARLEAEAAGRRPADRWAVRPRGRRRRTPLPVPVADSHCHLDMVADIGDAYDGVAGLTVDEALARAAAVGVTRIVQIGCDLPSARWSVDGARRTTRSSPGWRSTPTRRPGCTPRGELDAALAEIEALAAHPRVRVVGETGLDHFRTDADGWAVQEAVVPGAHRRSPSAPARALQIHDRDAHDDVLRVLESEGAPETVIFHCFSGDADMARRCVERGYLLSFAGTVTFKNAGGLREALKVTPLEHLLVETDAPFLAPAPHRGHPNASYLIPRTLRVMAEVLDVDVATLAPRSTRPPIGCSAPSAASRAGRGRLGRGRSGRGLGRSRPGYRRSCPARAPYSGHRERADRSHTGVTRHERHICPTRVGTPRTAPTLIS